MPSRVTSLPSLGTGKDASATPPLYYRWVNHVVWRDRNGLLWEGTPIRDEIDRTTSWLPTTFVADENAEFVIASEEFCCPLPAVYVAARPEGEWTADCLCQLEQAGRSVQDLWLDRALFSLRQAGFEPTSRRVKRVGDILRNVWIYARPSISGTFDKGLGCSRR